ncbi:MAG: hypothetical protein C4520_09130 [Candidatus Abyssobacteria bacterium SURF_5]|uniref:Uncharacterized protein n=1 Tax=Abyssobacteria bacterium (strain SURF_5) TaxID=2093360 RepID=A0A3A4NSM3_ABYX5|nr:MAG: hypothetical protein C4520_09130 [Candidatus Abyssubacteria bacterium SURF_5]
MKIKLNMKQIAVVARELKETDRKNFDVTDVAQVFKMLQYWVKTAGSGKEKIQSVTELPDGYLCRVNSTFHDAIKAYIREIGSRKLSQQMHDIKAQEAMENYDRLIKEAEEGKRHLGK